ncbi:MAG: 6,7-dimethyl-8-ribityllumazine synthase [Bacteroidota bacterium]
MNIKNRKKEHYSCDASKFRFTIVVSAYNEYLTAKLLEGAEECFRAHRVPRNHCKVVFCPGAFELPQVANRLAAQKKVDAIVCLGAVVRGETPHFEYVSSAAAQGILQVSLRWSLPVIFGVLTTDSVQQALDRLGGKHGHKGWDAALTALKMADLFRSSAIKRRV